MTWVQHYIHGTHADLRAWLVNRFPYYGEQASVTPDEYEIPGSRYFLGEWMVPREVTGQETDPETGEVRDTVEKINGRTDIVCLISINDETDPPVAPQGLPQILLDVQNETDATVIASISELKQNYPEFCLSVIYHTA